MKARGKFIFKEIRRNDAGSFTNASGQTVNYKASYTIKADENTERGIQERTFKIPEDSVLVQEFQKYESYTELIIDFDVQMYTNSTRIVPIAISTK